MELYFNLWEAEAEAEAKQKQESQEPSQEAEAKNPTITEFFIYSDGVKHNRNIVIIDSKEKYAQNKREFKVIGKLSKAEQKILRAIK